LFNGGIKPKDIEELRSKSKAHSDNIQGSLARILNSGRYGDLTSGTDQEREIKRNLQMSHLAQTGRFHSSISGITVAENRSREEIFQRADKDILKRFNPTVLTPALKIELTNNVKSGKFKDIIMGMENEAIAREINRDIQNGTIAGANADRLRSMSRRDTAFRSFV